MPRPRSLLPFRLDAAVAVLACVLTLALPLGGRIAEAAPAPTVTGVSPGLGPAAGGTVVTISGTGFVAGASVTFAGAAASSVTIGSSTQITATTPAGAAGTAALVAVTNVDGQGATLSGGFIYQFEPPTVSGVVAGSGTSAGGTAITITGTGFRSGASASFAGKPATAVVVVNPTTITATTPANLVGAANVIVANTDAQSATLAAGYTYTAAPAPTVTSVAPTAGTAAGGTPVTITGTGFVAGAMVTIGGAAATSVVVTAATTITATTPARSPGAATIVVTNPDTQSGAAGGAYTYSPLPAPTVASITPATGPAIGGTAVTIAGTGFVTGASVTLGGTPLTGATVVSPTSISGTTAVRAAGVVSVLVTNPDGQSGTLAAGFTAAANAAPVVTTVTPATGSTSGSTAIAITGTGFLAGATVVIGGAAASSVSVLSSTLITAVTPARAVGAAAVSVTNYDGQAGSNITGYAYTANSAPVPTAVVPATGTYTGGTIVTITGTGFSAGASVLFGPFSGYNVVVAGSTSILVTTPAGSVGNVPIVVNTGGEAGILATGFTYQAAPPTVSALDPATGPTAGGTQLTIVGTNFATGATVTFGGVPGSGVIGGGQTLVVTTPAGKAAGAADVAVTNPGSAAATLAGGFTYVGAATTTGGAAGAAGAGGVAPTPPIGGMSMVVAGTSNLTSLIAAQKFTVVAAYTLDVAKQIWKVWVAGSPVNSITTLAPNEIVIFRR